MRFAHRLLVSNTLNLKAEDNYRHLADLLRKLDNPRVLVVGGRTVGEGMEAILALGPGIHLIQTDITPGPQTEIVCDAHQLPFAGGSMDGVIIQAVLEHVFDPGQCVEEIYRVLRPSGLVYAETPFMQQVHLGAYDFTRFTHLGHRRLFRRFDEISSGPTAGPATALAWAWRHFLTSWSSGRVLNFALEAFARLTAWPLLQFDRWLIDRPASYDAGSAYYFLGRRSDGILSDAELVQLYRGRQRRSLEGSRQESQADQEPQGKPLTSSAAAKSRSSG